jgi:hypothetical protein
MRGFGLNRPLHPAYGLRVRTFVPALSETPAPVRPCNETGAYLALQTQLSQRRTP